MQEGIGKCLENFYIKDLFHGKAYYVKEKKYIKNMYYYMLYYWYNKIKIFV